MGIRSVKDFLESGRPITNNRFSRFFYIQESKTRCWCKASQIEEFMSYTVKKIVAIKLPGGGIIKSQLITTANAGKSEEKSEEKRDERA